MNEERGNQQIYVIVVKRRSSLPVQPTTEATAHLLVEDIANIRNHSLPAIPFCCQPILLFISSCSKGLLWFYWNGNRREVLTALVLKNDSS
jgi:hypothetical protein